MANINLVRTDPDKELHGVWVDFAEGIELKIARSGNSAYLELLKKLSEPHVQEIRDGSVDEDLYDDILRKVRASTILLDWKNIEDDTGTVSYSVEKAYEYFADPSLKDFYNFVIIKSQDIDKYRKVNVEASVKNSKKPSSTSPRGEDSNQN
jgi:hypothetical protein